MSTDTPKQDLREHTPLTDKILAVIDQQPPNRYEVALRMTRFVEAYVAEAERHYTVNRLEVIDHVGGEGRAYVKWEDFNFEVELSEQDGGRTLKVFLSSKEQPK